jgi:murein DD-endopeptidase MepM/ murein hydrolase activator NlpD
VRPDDRKRVSIIFARPGGRPFLTLALHPVWAMVAAALLVGLVAAEVAAVLSYVGSLRKLRSYSALMVETDDLRRQNATLLELDKELRTLLVHQQRMLRLAGIETALRPDLEAGDNSGERTGVEGADSGFHLPALGETTRGFDAEHRGVDLGLPRKRAVTAAAAGTVIEAGRDAVMGNRLVIQHSDSVRTVYANNERNLVAAGDTVLAGEVIALVGSGFEGEEPHLHFEVWIRGTPVPPESVLAELEGP